MNGKKRWKGPFVALTTLAIVASTGCAQVQTDGGDGFSAIGKTIGEAYDTVQKRIEKALEDRGNRYCLQAAGIGALAGAAAGAGIGYAATRDTTGLAIGAVIGGIGGALASCQYGVWVADRRETYDSEQARLTAELQNAADTNESLTNVNDKLASNLAARERKLAEIRKVADLQQMKRVEKEKLAKELAQDRKGIDEQLQQVEKELDVHKKTLADMRRATGDAPEREQALSDLPVQKAKKSKSKKTSQLADLEQSKPSAEVIASFEPAAGPMPTSGIDPGSLAEYKKRVTEMEKAVAQLRELNVQYAATDTRVANL